MKKRSKLFGLLLPVLLLLASGCDHVKPLAMSVMSADMLAQKYGLTKKIVPGGKFYFTTYQHFVSQSLPFKIYIEGDGRSGSFYSLPQNPTPLNPYTLVLAAMDAYRGKYNIVYIARPCQYTPMAINPACTYEYWGNKRWSQDSVDAMSEALNSISRGRDMHLVGFSGGGGIAVLIAAQNPRVKSIVTIAGNMDIVEFNKYHNTNPSIGSLNPINYAVAVNGVPQLHFSGSNDNVVPPFLIEGFVKASANPACIKHQIIPDMPHSSFYWKKVWAQLSRMMPSCAAENIQ